MNKTIKYIVLGLAAGLLAVSCDITNLDWLNPTETFDDANAFVAFDKTAYTVSEDSEDVLRIPVTLASVAGLEETVSFKVVEPETKAAKAGVNYELLTTSGVLSFNQGQRTDYIEFTFMPDGTYTGDLSFNIVLNEGSTIGTGAASTCTVTISDIDHPLSALLGSYTASGENYWYGQEDWTMDLVKDADDDHKVWFNNIFDNSGWAGSDMMYYGNVNAEMTSINLPFGQTAEYLYGGTYKVYLYGLDSSFEGYDTGSMTIEILKDADGNVTGLDFGDEYGVWCYIEDQGSVGIVLPGITAVKD